jgi:hypothetical protein
MRIAIGLMLTIVLAAFSITFSPVPAPAATAMLATASASNADTERIEEQVVTESDLRQTRTLTLSARPQIEAPPTTPLHHDSPYGTLLWTDRSHLNAIANDMAITGQGDHIVAGWWLNNERVAVYETMGAGVPLWTYPINSSFFLPVDASDDGGLITGTGRQDNLYAWSVASSTPYCSQPYPASYEGYLAVTPDVGGVFVGSSTIPGGDSSKCEGYDDGCAALWAGGLPGTTQGGRFAAGGEWVAVNSRTHTIVYNATTGAVRDTVEIPGETQAAVGISGDGNILALGGFAHRTYVYEWNGSEYELLWQHFINMVTWITAITVSDDGSTVMVGTVLLGGDYLGRVVMYDVDEGPTPLWTNSDFGDQVNAVALSADGSVGVAASWGRYLGTFGHLVAAFTRDNPTPFFTVDDEELFGVASAYTVDLSNDGRFGCAGGKAVHAREFGNGGYTLAFELNPTTAVQLDPATAPGASELLVVGQNRPNPLNPTTSIPFSLTRDASVRLRIVDAAGRAVRDVNLGRLPAGSHQTEWNGVDALGRPVASGVYFYEIDAEGETASRRLVITR